MELEYGHWQDFRRRSSRPAAPPPTIPIPSLPPRAIRSSSFAKPPAAPLSMSSISDALSDPPPQSQLPAATSSSDRNQNRRSSLAPQNPNRSEHRPSSRRALTRALELAREAVQLDSTNDNPVAAVNAYAQSVALLSEVMERVRNGEDSTESNRRRQRRSISAQEKEVRRLQNIVRWFSSRLEQLHSPVSILARYLRRSNEYFEHHLQHSCSTLPYNISLCQYHNFYRLCYLQLPHKLTFSHLRYFSTSTTRSVSLLCPK